MVVLQNQIPEPLYYSYHVTERCFERDISYQQIEDAVRLGTLIYHDNGKCVYQRGRLRVVMLDSGLVVTACRKDRSRPKRLAKERRQERRKRERRYARGFYDAP